MKKLVVGRAHSTYACGPSSAPRRPLVGCDLERGCLVAENISDTGGTAEFFSADMGTVAWKVLGPGRWITLTQRAGCATKADLYAGNRLARNQRVVAVLAITGM
ncbi:hypothetical protein PSEUDO9AZ_40881 [Pseudomonas sp. 9AZ]|nr:hypothetical protein PSEUDO9AZ_40881 [Pseudomonas sp. 9AZ]